MNELAAQCPYCFEWVDVAFEEDVSGELVQDCEVCCQPWLIRLHRDLEGFVTMDVSRAQ